MKYNYDQIQQLVSSKGYNWFNRGDYDLNIVGLRTFNPTKKITNKFDDLITVSYTLNNNKQYLEFPITTEPGLFYSQNLLNADGVAILVPGQYIDTWILGLHQGKYEALVQRKPVKVYRDKNKNDIYDTDEHTISSGLFGINIHRSAPKGESLIVDRWSAGCQVFKRAIDFNTFMDLCHKSSKLRGNQFTYTLIENKV